MLSLSEMWNETWRVKLLSLISTFGLPMAVLFLAVVIPSLLAPVLILVTLGVSLFVFSLWTQHRRLKADAEVNYSLRADAYVLIKWSLVHAAVALGVFPVVYLVLHKLVPVLFLPLLGSSMATYLVFVAIESWIAGRAADEVAS